MKDSLAFIFVATLHPRLQCRLEMLQTLDLCCCCKGHSRQMRVQSVSHFSFSSFSRLSSTIVCHCVLSLTRTTPLKRSFGDFVTSTTSWFPSGRLQDCDTHNSVLPSYSSTSHETNMLLSAINKRTNHALCRYLINLVSTINSP